ncbi:MAG TPA: hypothetical protein VGT98_10575 [Candidatus Elarobacter sp.]|nr:hypothetical protein [Candidatus Elarobacter sp.]
MHRQVDSPSPSPRVALATSAAHPDLTDDDRPLLATLAAHGIRAEPAVWNDPAVEWSEYAAVVIRSCWDYHYRADEFLAWVDALEAADVLLLNPPDVVRWNADKTYLRDLEAAGVRTVPTRWLDATHAQSLSAILEETGWRDAVIKPSVSASARDTWRVQHPPKSEHDARMRTLVERGTVLVQPYMDVIASQGELSLVFLDGRYSHAVLKRPKAGDFRVQTEHGGSVEEAYPNDRMVRQAADVLRAAPDVAMQSLYARVDGVIVDGELVLMELELIEPALYLSAHPRAAARLASAIARRVGALETSARP